VNEPAPVSDRSRGVTLGLAVVGGVFGLHRFYAGRVESGVWMCLTLGGLGVWYLYDVVVIAASDMRDGEGRRIARWGVAEGASPPAPDRLEDAEERLGRLESHTAELAERLDFAERLLAQQRERERLPRGDV
jgi:hypothetical protein